MPFNTFGFILLAVLTIAASAQLQRAHRHAAQYFLIIVSLGFYALWNPSDLPILLTSQAANFAFASKLASCEASRKKTYLALFVSMNLLVLAWFKVEHLVPLSMRADLALLPDQPRVGLPLGISFFTFQQIAYLVFIAKNNEPLGLKDYSFVINFFPHLVAGPLVRHSDMRAQLAHPAAFRIKAINLFSGASLFTIGLSKKVFLADPVAHFVNPIFAAVDNGTSPDIASAWAAAVGGMLNIYFDFSAYSDMACGIAIALGIRLPLNFYSPLKATNMEMFWNRWNISITSFIREHVFRPLAGKNLVVWRHIAALPITMIVAGIWHGTNWNFLVWGALHGALAAYDHARTLLLRRRRSPKNASLVTRTAGWVKTHLILILFGCIFSTTTLAGAGRLISGMFNFTGSGESFQPEILTGIFRVLPMWAEDINAASSGSVQMFVTIAATWAIALTAPNSAQLMWRYRPFQDSTRLLRRTAPPSRGALTQRLATPGVAWLAIVLCVLTLCFLQMLTGTPSPFHYYKY